MNNSEYTKNQDKYKAIEKKIHQIHSDIRHSIWDKYKLTCSNK